ncbi:MAG: hypothetical protein P8M78_06450 [Myxococcota bacterium]|nr:hypothetical protein [Myxococcota bacterium]
MNEKTDLFLLIVFFLGYLAAVAWNGGIVLLSMRLKRINPELYDRIGFPAVFMPPFTGMWPLMQFIFARNFKTVHDRFVHTLGWLMYVALPVGISSVFLLTITMVVLILKSPGN